MRFILREKFFAFGEDFYIQDEYGRNVFLVDGKMFSIGDNLSIRDMAGNEVATIRQRLIALRPTYEIERNGQHAATINKALFSFFTDRFTIDVPGPGDFVAHGDFWEHEYAFERGGQAVAYVSKQWFSFRDTYGVEVADGEDAILILATAVVIDLISNDEERRRQQNR
jgi:uncharacterized protein YxjI